MSKKFFLSSLGCSKNTVDSENMMALLKNEDYLLTDSAIDAEIIIINTCGFILDAQEESVNTILQMAEYKKHGKCELLIVSGCLSQRFKKDLVDLIPEVDIFMGTTNFHLIGELVRDFYIHKEKEVKIDEDFSKIYELPRSLSTPSHYAYVKISEGCDNLCTYCIIPKLRGPYRSRKMEDIILEVERLTQEGVKEIVLIAEDITLYGKDLYGSVRLVELLEELVKISSVRWIRLLYCYPNNFSDELIKTIKENEKICKYVDIPLQHANDKVLRRMGRKISQEEIRGLLKKLRTEIPEIKIRSTFIVGFPGETEEQFEDLLKFLKKEKLDYVGAFPYSREEGTPAYKLDNQLEDSLKEVRVAQLMKQQYEILQDNHEKYLNKVLEVQIDKKLEDSDNIYLARSQGQAPDVDPYIYLQTDRILRNGDLVEVRISHLDGYDLIGEIEK